MLNRDFLKCVETICFPIFAEHLCVYFEAILTLNWAGYNSMLAFTSYLHRTSKVSQRWVIPWSECLCPQIFTCWNPNLQSDVIRRYGLWEVISDLIKEAWERFHSKKEPYMRKWTSIRHWICWWHDLGIFSLQNCEE